MKFHYYPETDSLYIDLAERPSTDSRDSTRARRAARTNRTRISLVRARAERIAIRGSRSRARNE